jgi:pimeloyl-ACP methyl ester carboxylesterase
MPLFARPIPALEIAYDEGRGPIVVLVHGIASSAVAFENLRPLLTKHFRVIAVNLLGCGNSPAPDIDYTTEQHVAALRSTLLRRGIIAPFTLVGYSMGGLISARFTAKYPWWVKRLVLVGTPIYPPMETVANPIDRAQLGLYNDFYNYLKANPTFTAISADAVNALSPIKNMLVLTERSWDATKRSMTNVIQRQTALADLSLIRVPVDLVFGTIDPFLSKLGTTAATRLPNVTAWPVDLVDHVIRPPLAKVVAGLLSPN